MSRIEQIQQMLKDEPNDSFLNYALALEYGKTEDFTKAIEIIETVLQRDPNYLGAYYQLGKYYECANDEENAINTYKKGIKIAIEQQNKKTENELSDALWMLED